MVEPGQDCDVDQMERESEKEVFDLE